MNSDIDDKNSGIITCDDIPIDSLYCRNSCKVWLDKIYRIGDHRLLSCQILDNTNAEVDIIYQEIGDPLEFTKWKRNDYGNLNYWTNMQISLESKLNIYFL